MITQALKTKKRWENYKKCTLYTEYEVYSLTFDVDYKDYEMIGTVLDTYELSKSEITGIKIAKCKFLCND